MLRERAGQVSSVKNFRSVVRWLSPTCFIAEVDMTEALGKIDDDALAAEFERYLRRRGPGFRG